MKFIKDTIIQNEFSQTIDKYNKESFSTGSQIVQNARIQNIVFEQAKNILAETISDTDIELQQKDAKKHFLEDKRGIPDSKILEDEEMNRLDSNKVSSKDKCDRILKRLNKTLHFHRYIKD